MEGSVAGQSAVLCRWRGRVPLIRLRRHTTMSAGVSLYDRDPNRSFRSIIEGAVRTATELDVATAFMTKAGVDFYSRCAARIGEQRCRLCVSVHFPTDLDALS